MAEPYRFEAAGMALGRAVGLARGFIGEADAAYLHLEVGGSMVDLIATDRSSAVRVACPTTTSQEEPLTFALHKDVLQVVAAFLTMAAAHVVTVSTTQDLVGFSYDEGHYRLLLPRAHVKPLPWRERLAGRASAYSIAVNTPRLRAALSPMQDTMLISLPAGDGQALHFIHPDDASVEVWVMPLATTAQGALNQREGGQPPVEEPPLPPAPTGTQEN